MSDPVEELRRKLQAARGRNYRAGRLAFAAGDAIDRLLNGPPERMMAEAERHLAPPLKP